MSATPNNLAVASPAFTILPVGWDAAWRAGKATAGSAILPAMVIGDSIAQGFYATAWRTQSWQGLVRTALQAKYGSAGEYISLADTGIAGNLTTASTFGPAPGALTPLADYQWVATLNTPGSTWVTLSYATGGPGTRPLTNNAADTYVLTPALGTFTDFDLWAYRDASGGSFTVDANIGTPSSPNWVSQAASSGVFATNGNTVPPTVTAFPVPYTPVSNPTLSFLASGAFQRSAVFSGWTSAGTTMSQIRITNTGGGLLYLSGANIYPTGRATSGVFWTKHALQGSTAGRYGIPPYPSVQPYFLASPSIMEDYPLTPKLVIVSLGVNDMQGATGLDYYAYCLEQIGQSAARVGSSLLFLAPLASNNRQASYTPFTNADAWGEYRAVMRQTAGAFNAAYVDFHAFAELSPNPVTAYLYTGGGGVYNTHPSNAGHAAMANLVLSVL